MKTNEIIKRLEVIECNTLLAAKKVLTLEDVSVLTGLSRSHLYKLTCRKDIPHYRPTGKFLYFDRAEVEAWMKRGRVATNDEVEQKAINYVVAGQKGGAA